jgi:transcriptional regulator with XRE-family HTH domain
MSATMEVVKTVRMQFPKLNEKIKQARISDGRTITQICALADMTTANWYRIEAGKQSIPLDTLRKVESVLGVNFGVDF